jgi:hypothetical protein
MIRHEAEHEEAVRRLKQQQARCEALAAELTRRGLKPEEIKRATDPLRSFSLQLEDEVEAYERLERGSVGEPRR